MAVTIENPILNGPYDAPKRHFRFDEEGITSETVESRRRSAYFMPIARPKKRNAQKTFETEWTLDRIKETTEVNRIRERVDAWRAGGYVSVTRMNPDLTMGDELLKKTGAGNLFTVFGEPDVDIDRDADGNIIVRINGLDVYDPTTGQIRSNTTDDIACWFIDTNYNGESFFVRHAYFTGADEPYEKLKRALRAEIDEGTWSTLYSTVSRPFALPEHGKIAVKVINHYGDEVLKVFEV